MKPFLLMSITSIVRNFLTNRSIVFVFCWYNILMAQRVKCYTLYIGMNAPGFIVERGIDLDPGSATNNIIVGSRSYPLLSKLFGELILDDDRLMDFDLHDDLCREPHTLSWADGPKLVTREIVSSVLIVPMQLHKDDVCHPDSKTDHIEIALRTPSNDEYFAEHLKLDKERQAIRRRVSRTNNITDEDIEWDTESITNRKAELHKIEDSRRSYDIRTTGAVVVCPRDLTMDRSNQYLVNIAQDGAFEIKITRPRLVNGTFLSNVLSVRVETNKLNGELVSELSVYDPRVSLSIEE